MISFFAKRGFLDGRSGLVFASLKREYYSHIRLKILEMPQEQAGSDIDSSSSEAVRSPMDRDIPVTLIIPVKNEAKNLASCMDRVGRFQDVVVVDSGSTDATLDIAREYGATCIQFEWNGHFPKKRTLVSGQP